MDSDRGLLHLLPGWSRLHTVPGFLMLQTRSQLACNRFLGHIYNRPSRTAVCCSPLAVAPGAPAAENTWESVSSV